MCHVGIKEFQDSQHARTLAGWHSTFCAWPHSAACILFEAISPDGFPAASRRILKPFAFQFIFQSHPAQDGRSKQHLGQQKPTDHWAIGPWMGFFQRSFFGTSWIFIDMSASQKGPPMAWAIWHSQHSRGVLAQKRIRVGVGVGLDKGCCQQNYAGSILGMTRLEVAALGIQKLSSGLHSAASYGNPLKRRKCFPKYSYY